MKTISNKNKWFLINFTLFIIGAVFSSYRACKVESICIVTDGVRLIEIPILLLTILLIWLFSWALLCRIFFLEPKDNERTNTIKSYASYVLSCLCGFIYPYIIVGG